MNLNIRICDIRNINSLNVSLPFEKGMYALVGENGCGKSTLMLLLSLVIKPSSAKMITSKDLSPNSYVEISIGDKIDRWTPDKNNKLSTGKKVKRKDGSYYYNQDVRFNGFYEGSIFYGTRFFDYNKVTKFIGKADIHEKLIEADTFVAETLGYILHNDKKWYKKLKKIKSKRVAKEEGFIGIPYFYEIERTINNKLISQYQMSSGESMLISLIDFINNIIKRHTYDRILLLIDEVELALHPAAIDRLHIFLSDLIKNSDSEIIVYFSTHSAELIHRIAPRNIYLLENDTKTIEIINPCYPNYAIRSLYIPNGFDFLLLVEDELAKAIVDKVIRENNLASSKLICILPSGGCNQMLKLHHDMVTYNTLGVGKHIISIFDGDVKGNIAKQEEYKQLPKCFLPIPSVEKYLKSKLVDTPDKNFIKLLGDKYFNQRSLSDIIKDYLNDDRTSSSNDKDGKNFYSVICANLDRISISESDFIKYLSNDIYEYEKPTKFVESIRKLLS